MNERLSWMLPSIPVGRMFSTDIRLSWWFAFVPLITCPKYGITLGITFTVLLYFSVFLHEFAHVFAARWTGGFADEIQLSPWGGIAMVRPGPGPFAMGMTAAAGPIVNLVICLLTFPGWYARDTLWKSLNPLVLPIDHLDPNQLWHDLGLLLFIANWMPLLINLLPVTPLDGGLILRAILATRTSGEFVNRTAVHIGLAVAVLILAIGVVVDVAQVVLLGTFILTMNLLQMFQDETGGSMEDSGLGYDFSGGYDTLDESSNRPARQPGMIARWRERRRVRREQELRLRRVEAEQQLDSLLAKVHESGLQSLSEQEQKLLRNCSELLRERSKSDN